MAVIFIAGALGLQPPPAGASTTTTGAATFSYDAPFSGRVELQQINATEERSVLASGAEERSDTHCGGRGTSATPSVSQVATNSVDEVAGSEFLDDAIRSPVVRPDLGHLSTKIQRQMASRGLTNELIDEAVTNGRSFPAINKLGGADSPATRFVSPTTGQSVVIDSATGEVVQVGRPGFRY